MAVKIRLQRHGKKGQPFYHIVIADARAARDGKFIEKLGTYNPLTKPATIVINAESACQWLKNGAQPTDTVRSILRYKGILYKYHLQRGVEKGAFTQEVADKRYNDFIAEKENKIKATVEQERNNSIAKKKEALKAEADVNAKRAEAIAQKRAEVIAKQQEQEAKVETPATENAEEVAPATEETKAE
ncbi:MAG: 30S ribosomal protein S16 [Bacteroidales bacterium]|nr:30S ribosomal protein S16 [Bacteroidales bacterium]